MPFADIRGQDRAVGLLRQYLKTGRLSPVYLFSGPEGVGKKLTAKTLAQAANCLEQESDACGHCLSCVKIDKQEHPDFHLLDQFSQESPASEALKIEAVRQLQRDIYLKPYEARKKVFLIDNAHNLTAEAANALLKVLEEPPRESLIILITAYPNRVFKTILSRCRTIKFSCLARSKLEELLRKEFKFSPSEAHFLAYFSEGRLGYALALKDKDFFREKNAYLNELSATGRFSWEDEITADKEKMRCYLNNLAAWVRDIYLLKIGAAHAELINFDRRDELLRCMHRYTFRNLEASLQEICAALQYLEQNINSKLVFANLRYILKGQ